MNKTFLGLFFLAAAIILAYMGCYVMAGWCVAGAIFCT